MTRSCGRGKTNPDQPTRYRLWADSGGYCQNPDCLNSLFVTGTAKTIHFGEMAHVIAASSEGPRGDKLADEESLKAWDNIILLCANCHTSVDKSEADYPVETLRAWKNQRQVEVEKAVGVSKFSTRDEVRAAIEPYADESNAIHRLIGPDNDYRFDPDAEEAAMWRAAVASTIIPNHARILRIIDANQALLRDDEKATVAEYKLHVKGLLHRHEGGGAVRTVRYPKAMEHLYVG